MMLALAKSYYSRHIVENGKLLAFCEMF